MRLSHFIAFLFTGHFGGWNYHNSRIEPDQPLSFVLGGWSWSQSYLDIVDHEPVISFLSRPASFGPHVTEQPGLPGYLIPVSSIITTCPPSNITSSSLSSYDQPGNIACLPVCTDPKAPRPTRLSENWIALVQRGQCPFAEKVRVAQQLGAKGVVVGGWEVKEGDRDDLLNMFSPEDTTDITIPSTYVTFRSYTHLINLIDISNTTTSGLKTISVILRAEETWGWFSPILTFLMLLLLPSFLTFLTLVIHRLREARRERLDRAPEDVVSHLPTRIWSGKRWEKEGDWLKSLRERAEIGQSGALAPAGTVDKNEDGQEFDLEGQVYAHLPRLTVDGALEEDPVATKVSGDDSSSSSGEHRPGSVFHPEPSEDELPGQDQPWFNEQVECAICLCNFDPGDKVRVLPCGHLFHIEEVDGWLVQRKKLCPICKTDVTQPRLAASSPLAEDGASVTTSPRPRRPASRIRRWLSHNLPFFQRTPQQPPLPTGTSPRPAAVSPPTNAPTERTPLLPTPTS